MSKKKPPLLKPSAELGTDVYRPDEPDVIRNAPPQKGRAYRNQAFAETDHHVLFKVQYDTHQRLRYWFVPYPVYERERGMDHAGNEKRIEVWALVTEEGMPVKTWNWPTQALCKQAKKYAREFCDHLSASLNVTVELFVLTRTRADKTYFKQQMVTFRPPKPRKWS